MRSERGSSLIEVILLGLLFFVPLLWTLGFLSELHRAALAGTAAAREAGFDAARAADARSADEAVARAAEHALRDHGLALDRAIVRWGGTIDRSGAVEIIVRYPVSVARFPFLGSVSGPSVWVEARHIARVEPFRSRS